MPTPDASATGAGAPADTGTQTPPQPSWQNLFQEPPAIPLDETDLD
ncbi:hypothetical protein ACIOUE_01105 [Streptomyces xanthochromogenes]